MKQLLPAFMLFMTSMYTSAMTMLQSPPPPPPDPNASGDLGGADIPIDNIGLWLLITSIAVIVYYIYKNKKLVNN